MACHVARNKDGQLTQLKRVGVEPGYATFIECYPEFFQTQSLQVRNPADTDKQAVDAGSLLTAGDVELSAMLFDNGFGSQPERELFAQNVYGLLICYRILKSTDMVLLVNPGDVNAYATQGLPHLETDDTKPNDGQGFRKIVLLEDFICRENPIAKALPRGGDIRPGSCCNYDFLRADFFILDCQQVWFEEGGVTGDEFIAHLVCARRQHLVHEDVTEVLHMLQCGGNIHAQLIGALNALAIEQLAPLEILRHLDGGLRWHAPHAGAGCTEFTTIDQYIAVGNLAHLGQRKEAGRTRANDCNIHLAFHFTLTPGFRNGRRKNTLSPLNV
jgi:hypothetical protein